MYTTVICTHRTQAMTPSGKASCLDRGRAPGPSRWAPWRHPSPDHKPAADCTGPPAFPSSPPPVQPTSLRIAGTASAAHRCSAAPGAVPGGQNSPEHNNVVRDLQICYALNKTWGKKKKMRRWWRIREAMNDSWGQALQVDTHGLYPVTKVKSDILNFNKTIKEVFQMLTLACQSKSLECDIYLHSEKDFLQMTCKALHFSNLLLQLISDCDVLTLKTIQSHTSSLFNSNIRTQ